MRSIRSVLFVVVVFVVVVVVIVVVVYGLERLFWLLLYGHYRYCYYHNSIGPHKQIASHAAEESTALCCTTNQKKKKKNECYCSLYQSAAKPIYFYCPLAQHIVFFLSFILFLTHSLPACECPIPKQHITSIA